MKLFTLTKLSNSCKQFDNMFPFPFILQVVAKSLPVRINFFNFFYSLVWLSNYTNQICVGRCVHKCDWQLPYNNHLVNKIRQWLQLDKCT